jgi:hypothetical protein
VAGGDHSIVVAVGHERHAPISGRSVMMSLGSGATAQSCGAVTDAAGAASCQIDVVDQPVGTVDGSAAFAGDDRYQPATATGAVSVTAASG